MGTTKEQVFEFKARAHLLKLLGDELIGDDRLAVFELVKNAYDADASKVEVTLDLNRSPRIIIQDFSGCGMTQTDIVNKWMEIGTDSKRGQNRIRTKKFKRLPLGEKGVGRLAAHKLGQTLILNTRASGSPEILMEIHWPSLIANAEYIGDTKVTLQALSEPEYYKGDKTGTRIEVRDLYNSEWSRGDVRRLKKLITTLESPFVSKSSFDVQLFVPSREKELLDVLGANDILDLAIWRYTFVIDDKGEFKWKYNFCPPSTFRSLTKNNLEATGSRLELLPDDRRKNPQKSGTDNEKKRLLASENDLLGIGPIVGEFLVYIRRREVLNAQGAYAQVQAYLKEQTGVRVYRDGIRVYNYGEPSEDWLSLNTERINRPGERIGTDSIIGAIDLNLELSSELTEKTNREGFDENGTFRRFRRVVKSVMEHFQIIHHDDRQRLDDYIKGIQHRNRPSPDETFEKSLSKVRKAVTRAGLSKTIEKQIDFVEREYSRMREVAIGSGVAGLNLAVVFHEVEREIDWFIEALKRKEEMKVVVGRVEHLSTLMEGFAPLLRKSNSKTFKVGQLIDKTSALCSHRFEHHNVTFSCPTLTNECPNFEITGPFGLLQASLSNIIDNALHWSRYRAELEGKNFSPAIQIVTTIDYFDEGPAIIVADNGPGFTIDPQDAVEPFKSTRTGGMGLGLYYTNMILNAIGGKLVILDASGFDDVSKGYDGAAVAMIFKK